MVDGEGNDDTCCGPSEPPTGHPVPSKWWYVGHLFFWVITGLVVYVLYKDTNREAARRHLIVSLVLGIVAAIAFFAILVVIELVACGADPAGCIEYVDDW